MRSLLDHVMHVCGGVPQPPVQAGLGRTSARGLGDSALFDEVRAVADEVGRMLKSDEFGDQLPLMLLTVVQLLD